MVGVVRRLVIEAAETAGKRPFSGRLPGSKRQCGESGATILQRVTKLSERRLTRSLIRFGTIALLGWLSSGSSCADIGQSPTEQTCVVDSECSDESVCFQGICTLSCVTDEDCNGGVCRSETRDDDVVDVCSNEDNEANNTIGGECRFDADCEELVAGAQCGIDGACFLPAFSLLIRDTTPHDAVEDGGPGADIVAIYLQDPSTGEPVAWADTLSFRPAGDPEVQNLPDGTRVALAAGGTCVDTPFEQSATPLGGDGGVLLVQFWKG